MSLLAENLDILMFAALAAAILLGYPVVFTLAGLAVGAGAMALRGMDQKDESAASEHDTSQR